MNFEQFCTKIDTFPVNKITFVGIGNENRKDDFAGLYFLERLKKSSKYKKAHFINAGISPENHLQQIVNNDSDSIIFIDAAECGEKPGEISFIDENNLYRTNFSTHAYSISFIREYLSRIKEQKYFYLGIEPLEIGVGNSFSNLVKSSIDKFFLE